MRGLLSPRPFGFVLSAFLVLAIVVPAAATDADEGLEVGADPATVFDVRSGLTVLAPSPGQQQAIASLATSQPDVRIRWNATFGTPSSLLRYGGALSGPRTGAATDAARAWLTEHAGMFAWTASDVAALRVARSLQQPGSGPRAVLFHQVYGGLEGGSLGGSAMVTLDNANRVLMIRANVTRGTALAATGTMSAALAFQKATGAAAPGIIGTTSGWTTFAAGQFAGTHYAQKVAFPMPSGTRPAWEVIWTKQLDQGYRMAVDAATGDVLFRTQIVRHSSPEGTIFRNYPGAPSGGSPEVVSFEGDPEASPEGWLSPVSADLPAPTTVGNNAHTATNWAVFIAPEGGEVRPVAPDQHFNYEFTDAWFESECGTNPVSGGPGFPDTPAYAQDALPAVTNLFYHHNLMHDFWYELGFDEAAGNMQANNFGRGGEEGDPLLGLVQAGALGGDAPTYFGRDNAYMFPMPDGIPQWSGMFIWEPIPPADGGFLAPCVDGDFAADVIYHEYAHGVTSRWVGGEFGNLDSFHGGSMGEAWSDFAALHYLFQQGLEDRDVLGPYVTGNDERGIRNWPLSEVAAGFGDIGYDTGGDEVHADGEIWAGLLWDLRQALAGQAGGTDYAMQIVADAMPISGPLPTMLDMRDAILAADVARTGGANQDPLWEVFASHGMGASAQSRDANDTNPKPAFDHLDRSRNGAVGGQVVDASTRQPVAGAKIMVGDYEARTSPVVRANDDGFFNFPAMAGTWPVTIQAPGYGSRTVQIAVQPGRVNLRLELAVNLASTAAGARVVEVSSPSGLGSPELALSDSEVNAWWTDDDGDPTGEFFVVDLAGDQPVTIRTIQVSAFNTAGHRFEALKDFTVLTSVDGQNFTEVTSGSFPTQPPRPMTPDLHYRRFPLPGPVEASFIKFVADSPQDTTAGGVQVAEVQAFGAGDVVVEPPSGETEEPVHDEGLALVPTADATLTTNLMELGACVFPPPTQGLDAWVTELPDTYADGTHIITVTPQSLVPQVRADVDLFFLSEGCEQTGRIATASASESGTIPQASRYVVSQLYTSYASTITVDASPAP